MNTIIHFFKAYSLKASLPLLLLVTACGEELPSAQQADASASAADSVLAAAQPSGGFGMPSVDSAALDTPEVTLPDSDTDDVSFEDVLPPSDASDADAEDPTNAAIADVDASAVAASVPEPAALAGLAIATAGLLAIKRKQAA